MHTRTILLIVPVLCTLAACTQSPTATQKNQPEAPVYSEPHRPQFHFSPKEKWMNDPNGMFFYEGEYHLFYQYYPDSTVWGPMHWGHAVSRDLTHWEHLPVALYPDSLGYIFSGSAVVDWNNTSGFGKDGQPPIVAVFTYHNMAGEKAGRSDFQYQGIAYSNDKGRTWTKYTANPVVPNPGDIRDFRDPKVSWHETSGQWVMVLAVRDRVAFYGSKDLKKWAHLSDFGDIWGAHGGVWECPDLFPVRVPNISDPKWVLLVSMNPGAHNSGSGTQYFVGNFDGKKFKPDASYHPTVHLEQAVWLDYGRDNYAGVTWSDVPQQDGRRLFLGWMSNWDYANVVPTTDWRSAMTLPRTLELRKTAEGYRLFSNPVNELKKLRTSVRPLQGMDIPGSYDLTKQAGFSNGLLELEVDFEPEAGTPADFGIEISNQKGERYRIGYQTAGNQYYSDRTRAGNASFSDKFATRIHVAPRISTEKTVRFHVFFDVASAELFADDGETALTDIFFPTENFTQIKVYSEGGKVRVLKGTAWPLKSIWK